MYCISLAVKIITSILLTFILMKVFFQIGTWKEFLLVLNEKKGIMPWDCPGTVSESESFIMWS